MPKQIAQEVLDFLAEGRTLTLATSGDDGPWAATLTYVNDGSNLLVWMRPSTNTVRHIDRDPTVAFTIDRYSDDWRQTKGIQGRGSALAVQGEELAKAADLFGQKYPQLRPGATSAIVFFRIEAAELEYIDNTQGIDEGSDFGAEYRRGSAFR